MGNENLSTYVKLNEYVNNMHQLNGMPVGTNNFDPTTTFRNYASVLSYQEK